MDLVNAYSCSCIPGYQGTNCETGNIIQIIYDNDECMAFNTQHVCQRAIFDFSFLCYIYFQIFFMIELDNKAFYPGNLWIKRIDFMYHLILLVMYDNDVFFQRSISIIIHRSLKVVFV